MEELIVVIIGAIATGGGLSAFIGKIGNKKMIKDTISEIDKSQNKELSEISKDIDWIKERMLIKDAQEQLYRDIKKKVNSIVSLNSFRDKQLLQLMFNAQKELKEFIYTVISANYNLSNNEMYKEAKHLLTSAFEKTDIKDINLKMVSEYLLHLKNSVKALLKGYIINIEEIKDLKKEKQFEVFEKLTLNFVESIIVKTINLYQTYEPTTQTSKRNIA